MTDRVRVVRGNLAEQALAATGDGDVLFIDVHDQSVRFYSVSDTLGRFKRIARTAPVDSENQIRKTVASIYDGSVSLERALYIAHDWCGAMHADLVIAVPVESGSQADYSAHCERVEHLIDKEGVSIHFESFSMTDSTSLRQLARRSACTMMIALADNPLFSWPAINRLLDTIDCQVALAH
ncbi:MAG: hypothetical protein WBD13_00510 [Burkholderiaceae bacterium]